MRGDKYVCSTIGLKFEGESGEFNAITDVPGVKVGYLTIIEGEGKLQVGKGPIGTRVTANLPRGKQNESSPIWAGTYSLNGNGEMKGTHWINDKPICITNTHSVGTAHQAIVRWMINNYKK